MTVRILIMGLPGSGKTTLAQSVKSLLEVEGHTVAWFNADLVRQHYNDWDFSQTGRIRQSLRMRELADQSNDDYVIVDFVAPLEEMRSNFAADYTVWLDTIAAGRYEDTNQVFVAPVDYDIRVTEQMVEKWAPLVVQYILGKEVAVV